ncbi:uncharacterized protein FFUJ_06767 [Fusarium fujikuroi IMI 58289]|uniref:Uncharacterized protein n=2 Tax=Fusarium fujikuroi TaxID=5127 RepID=S0E632_GIBF5|nr:uncharacterized protein FFUJ_06767 [Fusarium fujikuroi IMI 58289]KLP00878.1 uncharacterized protein LW94_088 [Fusarium fujikuroi]CCT68013.1 uncharacterized protein FFUJ_06767 [Fusarium fujikuroi IMI 58289]SCN87440.1 uncharacterized protein FFE2_06420 [Fusarium fujikuroi]SCN93962.1 uncharacterized protein FFM5_05867 [Fusarium fujikuroi]SCO31057.1 uncharacterized protein FFNC_01749 [Fusarium fujikuroi]
MDPEELKVLTETLKEKAAAQHRLRVPFRDIQSERHRHVLDGAIKNALATELAQFTYAQIMDGLPTGDVCFERRFPHVFGEHPIDSCHDELCPGAFDKAQEYYQQWNSAILTFDPMTIEKYQHAEIGSRAFKTRLVELVAVALHEIAVLLFQLDFQLHRGGKADIDYVTNWRIPASVLEGLVDVPPRPTLFSHHAYLDADIYPNGVADIVGFWAEDRILGGVAIFDRRAETSSDTPMPNIYFHSCRHKQTYRVYQLRDDQQEALFAFLLAETDCPPPEPNPLPILSDAQNRVRVDSEYALTHHEIFRDIWERKPITIEQRRLIDRQAKSDLDYPEALEEVVRINEQLGFPIPKFRERSPSV